MREEGSMLCVRKVIFIPISNMFSAKVVEKFEYYESNISIILTYHVVHLKRYHYTHRQKTQRTQSPRPVYTNPAFAKSAGRMNESGHPWNVLSLSDSYLYTSSFMSGDNNELAVGRLEGSPDIGRPEMGWWKSPAPPSVCRRDGDALSL